MNQTTFDSAAIVSATIAYRRDEHVLKVVNTSSASMKELGNNKLNIKE